MSEVFDAVGCPCCGCACDDLRVTVAGGRVVAAERACRLAEPWFLSQRGGQPPAAWIGDSPVSVEQAVAAAADLLRVARRPVVWGMGRSLHGQRAALALADRLGATVWTAPDPHAVAVARVGEATATLGELRARAELVVLWGCDPDATHPRFRERYLPPAATVVSAGGGWDELWTLRQLVGGHRVDSPLKELADRLTAARSGVIVYDDTLAAGLAPHKPVEALLQLVTDLNRGGRWYGLRLTHDTSGAAAVRTWQTGYPGAVSFAAGYPRPADALAAADVCLLVGDGEPPAGVPVIAVGADHPGAAVRIATSVPGVHTAGVLTRMDGVRIPLRPLLPTGLPDDGEVLAAILAAVGTPAA